MAKRTASELALLVERRAREIPGASGKKPRYVYEGRESPDSRWVRIDAGQLSRSERDSLEAALKPAKKASEETGPAKTPPKLLKDELRAVEERPAPEPGSTDRYGMERPRWKWRTWTDHPRITGEAGRVSTPAPPRRWTAEKERNSPSFPEMFLRTEWARDGTPDDLVGWFERVYADDTGGHGNLHKMRLCLTLYEADEGKPGWARAFRIEAPKGGMDAVLRSFFDSRKAGPDSDWRFVLDSFVAYKGGSN